ncbi:MAG: hypothetical protein ABL921_34305 [Pirellula sp.]
MKRAITADVIPTPIRQYKNLSVPSPANVHADTAIESSEIATTTIMTLRRAASTDFVGMPGDLSKDERLGSAGTRS